jgi:hypothetical protein
VAQVRRVGRGRRDRVGELRAAHEHSRARVDDERGQLTRREHGGRRHGHRAHVHRREDAGGQLDVVGHAQQHPLLRAHADRDEARGDPADLRRELGVRVRAARVAEGDPRAVTGVDASLRQVGGSVEQFRHGAAPVRSRVGPNSTDRSRCVNVP